MEQENLALQIEEVEALSSIYVDEWKVEGENEYSMKIGGSMTLYVTLPQGYPLCSPPSYQLSAPELSWFRGSARTELCARLDNLYADHMGESILFMWIELLREYLQDMSEKENIEVEEGDESDKLSLSVDSCSDEGRCPNIVHGEGITDRKSTFQGHVAQVTCEEEVRIVLRELKRNKKIAAAAHNIYAYRIWVEERGSWMQDCEDDGETHAGGRLLHLLQITDARNVVVVVSRWYGGILLGPDRFKHINNAARMVLQQEGFIKEAEKKKKK